MNKTVSINEMINKIKKQMKWSDAILALELGVEPKNLNAWRKGTIPRLPNYKKLKGIYDSLKIEPETNCTADLNKLQYLDKEIEELTLKKYNAEEYIIDVTQRIRVLKKSREKLFSQRGLLNGK